MRIVLQKRERGRMRVHHLNNVNKALQILEQNNVSTRRNCGRAVTAERIKEIKSQSELLIDPFSIHRLMPRRR